MSVLGSSLRVVVALAIVAFPVAAQRAERLQAQPGMPAQGRAGLERQFRERLAEVVRRRLNLNETQMRQLGEVNNRYERERMVLLRDERQMRQALRAEVLADQPSPSGRWQTICGTSLATPLFAGVVALADQVAGHSLGVINPALYQMAAARDPGIVDVQGGDNTVHSSNGAEVRGFRAGPGFDLASGLGTINAAQFVPELARLAG